MSKISFLKVREVKNPARNNSDDAGIDFYVPKFTPEFISDLKSKNPIIFEDSFNQPLQQERITINNAGGCHTETFKKSFFKFDEEKGSVYFELDSLKRILIPSGLHVKFGRQPKNKDYAWALIANNKSGVSTKYGLDVGAAVVDQGYQGEIHLSLLNPSDKAVKIYEGMKIIQFIETQVFTSEVEVVSEDVDTFYDKKSSRSDKGFGESDNR
jgi:dUTPase